MKKIFYIFIISLLLISCSSLPKKRLIINPTSEQAAQLSAKALQMEKMRHFNGALTYYQYALMKYQLTDDMENVIKVKIAIARQFYSMNKKEDFYDFYTQAQKDLSLNPEFKAIKTELSLFKLEFLYHEAQYDSMQVIIKGLKTNNDETLLRKLAWDCLSRFEMNKLNKSRINRLNKESNRALKRYKKKKYDDLSAVSFAFYTLGYTSYHYKTSNATLEDKRQLNRLAIDYFQKAYEVDVIDQNFYNIATDLYYIASAYKNLENYAQASHYFLRAYQVYQQINESDKANYSYYCHLRFQWEDQPEEDLIKKMRDFQKEVKDPDLLKRIEDWLNTNQ